MSIPSSASEDISPTTSVRFSGAHSSNNHGLPSPTQPKAITAPTPTEIRFNALTRSLTDTVLYKERPPQLSERDSIFATHYVITGSEDSTPRLRPSQGGSDDLQRDSQDGTLLLDLSTVPPSETFRVTPSTKRSRSRLSNNQAYSNQYLIRMSADSGNFSRKDSMIHKTSPTRGTPPSSGSSEDLNATLLEREPAQDKLPKIPSSAIQTPCPELSARKRMSDLRDRQDVAIHQGPYTVEVRSTKENPGLSGGNRARSSSHSGRPYVDKKIEATLPDGDPTSNTRSRKASHYLGLFRGNSSAVDGKGDQEKASTVSGGRAGKVQVTRISPQEDVQSSFEPPEDTTAINSGPPVIDPGDNFQEETQAHRNPLAEKQQNKVEEARPNRPKFVTPNGVSSPNALVDISNRSSNNTSTSIYDTDLEEIESAAQFPQNSIPLSLLEEIRSYHNLTTPFHHRLKSPQMKIAQADGINDHKTFANEEQKSRSPTEEDESDNEQISSALYYPHQRPSGTQEDENIDESLQDEEQHEADLKARSSKSIVLDNDEPFSEGVDIALQSQNRSESSYLHGDLQSSRVSSKGSVTMKSFEGGTSSASESDYESLDEPDLTDDAETTPKATPALQSNLFDFKSRNPRPQIAPLGAVELKPYNHQVGGHTTVFRFSKRAVCKQLSNRENEFYEVIERRHPELLRFLPRYVYSNQPYNLFET